MAGEIIALLGSFPPRRCGIATFTEDLAIALRHVAPDREVAIVAMNDGESYSYPPDVVTTIDQADLASYEAAADDLNARNCRLLCVQHEFGIFGGPDGSFLLAMLRRVRAPIVTTLHTVLERFTPGQAEVLEELVALSSRLVVMSARAVDFLAARGVPRQMIVLIGHGVPEIRHERQDAKARMGLAGREVILTFGLLSPGKGIETALRALPGVVRERPKALYLVLGATHPHVRARDGEVYRDSLVDLADSLAVSTNVRFDGTYSDRDGLVCALAAADICLLPYQSVAQITSGTLAYAVGNGKAVVSTPFWHAEELLAEGRGVLTPFGDPDAMGCAVCRLLGDPDGKAAVEERARAYGVRLRWPDIARSYLAAFEGASRSKAFAPIRLPAMRLDHIAALADDTGLLQHAIGAVPSPAEGYTTDDNARALHLAVLAKDDPHAAGVARRTLSFLSYALDPARRRFRNFMAYDRRWADGDGGDNAQARAVRALVAASGGLPSPLAGAARELLARSWSALEEVRSPRAQAIALVAMAEHHEARGLATDLRDQADYFAHELLQRLADCSMPGWCWFETSLGYSNAKIPHGLIAYGRVHGVTAAVDAGLDALRWLEAQQTAPHGGFAPIGCERPYVRGGARPLWDGQPIEVYASVSAALEAHRTTGDIAWLAAARRALEWLLGRNALGIPLYDAETGGCRDGLHRDRANANQGAESTLALWLSLAEYQRVTSLSMAPRAVVPD